MVKNVFPFVSKGAGKGIVMLSLLFLSYLYHLLPHTRLLSVPLLMRCL